MSDEGFHEIQLNGKQLVFLFMAATVVSVVIFLCGVMVGRGVRTERAAVAETSVASETDTATRALENPEPPMPATSRTSSAPPAVEPPTPVQEDVDVVSQLEGAKPRPEAIPTPSTSQKTVEEPAPPAKREEPKREPPAPKKEEVASKGEAPARPPAATSGPTQQGAFAVQLVALRERSEAESIVSRLVGKGYPAYVLVPSPGSPPVYRVQVGRFKSRGDAEKTASRLKKEEQFNPWVTR
jgi:cell division septation protein DedD